MHRSASSVAIAQHSGRRLQRGLENERSAGPGAPQDVNAARPAWLVVGAPRNGSSGTESGASCVYRRGPSGWTYEDELAASNGSALAAFGDEVDVHGQTILVAAPCAARRGAVAGAVDLLARGGFVWTELADAPSLTPSTEARRGNRTRSGADPLRTAGQRVFAQWRTRDPADPAGFGDGFPDAVRFTVCP